MPCTRVPSLRWNILEGLGAPWLNVEQGSSPIPGGKSGEETGYGFFFLHIGVGVPVRQAGDGVHKATGSRDLVK